jgi:regulator of sigma E protease
MAKLSQASILNTLILLPLIAVNLGIFNLFPIPALDGSKIIFTLIEWIRKKPINRNIENIIHFVGFVLLLGSIILIDLLRFIQ